MVDRCIGTQAGRLLNNYIQFDLGEMIDGLISGLQQQWEDLSTNITNIACKITHPTPALISYS